MKRVTGIGGIFIKAKDPAALGEWYRKHLGISVESWGTTCGTTFNWDEGRAPKKRGETVWSLFNEENKYFDPSPKPYMINYRVEDLAALLAVLKSEGCDVSDKVEESEFGKFGWVMDPEQNRIELWEPPDAE